MKSTLILALLFVVQVGKGQTIEKYYQNKDFEHVIEFEKDTSKLTGVQLYFLGYAFFQLEDDTKALKMYDKAIEKGLNEGYIHFYRALALKYQKKPKMH